MIPSRPWTPCPLASAPYPPHHSGIRYLFCTLLVALPGGRRGTGDKDVNKRDAAPAF